MAPGAAAKLSHVASHPVVQERYPILVQGASLVGSLQIQNLGTVVGNVVWLDVDAAGCGWFVDMTPWDDSEFTTVGHQGERGRMDLLTVVEHEVGHLLDRGHEASGVMQETLTAGTRRTVGPVLAAAPDGLSVVLTGSDWAEETPRVGGRHRGHGGSGL